MGSGERGCSWGCVVGVPLTETRDKATLGEEREALPSSCSWGMQGGFHHKTFQAQGNLLDKTAGSTCSPLRKLRAQGWVQGKCGSEFQKERFGIY